MVSRNYLTVIMLNPSFGYELRLGKHVDPDVVQGEAAEIFADFRQQHDDEETDLRAVQRHRCANAESSQQQGKNGTKARISHTFSGQTVGVDMLEILADCMASRK